MKLNYPIKLSEILKRIDLPCVVIGNEDIEIQGFNDDAVAEEYDMTWIPRRSLLFTVLNSPIRCFVTDYY